MGLRIQSLRFAAPFPLKAVRLSLTGLPPSKPGILISLPYADISRAFLDTGDPASYLRPLTLRMESFSIRGIPFRDFPLTGLHPHTKSPPARFPCTKRRESASLGTPVSEIAPQCLRLRDRLCSIALTDAQRMGKVSLCGVFSRRDQQGVGYVT